MKKLILAITTLVFSVGVNAACNTASLKGNYGLGILGGSQSKACAYIGQFVFNGDGTLSVTYTEGCGGEIVTYAANGTYNISKACVGYVQIDNVTGYFVMERTLKMGQIMISQNNSIAYGTVFKQ